MMSEHFIRFINYFLYLNTKSKGVFKPKVSDSGLVEITYHMD